MLAGLDGWLSRLGWLAAGWLAGCWLDAWKLETLFLDLHTLDALKGSADFLIFDFRHIATEPHGHVAT